MNDDVKRVLNGWLSLSLQERNALDEAIRDHQRKQPADRIRAAESVAKVATGPLGGGCPCCGR